MYELIVGKDILKAKTSVNLENCILVTLVWNFKELKDFLDIYNSKVDGRGYLHNSNI